VSIRDPLFAPRRTQADVITHCRLRLGTNVPITDVYAHAIATMRVPLVRDLDVTDGPLGEFIRTGHVGNRGPWLWGALYKDVAGALPADQELMSDMLGRYLLHHAGRGPVDGWPNAGGE